MQFTEPKSREEAEKRLAAVIEDGEVIQDQMGDTSHPDKSDDEYFDWKQKARSALTYKRAELRNLKAWIKTDKTDNHEKKEVGEKKELADSIVAALKNLDGPYPDAVKIIESYLPEWVMRRRAR